MSATGDAAELYRLGTVRKLLISGTGDVMILSSKQVEAQLTAREMDSLCQRWLGYKIRNGGPPAFLALLHEETPTEAS